MLDRIRSEIEAAGPIPFDRFMTMALYDPDRGYFTASTALRSSTDGDFLTSPEVSPLFGATLARFVDSEAERIGLPPSVVDAGAGSGSLLRALLDSLAAPPPDVYAVEVSPSATERVLATVPEATVLASIADLPVMSTGVVIANELLDNLPAAIAVRRGDGWAEKVVTVGDGVLALAEQPARPEVAAWAEAHSGPITEGGLVEAQMQASAWVVSAMGRFGTGALVVIDYGDTAEALAPRRMAGTVRTYRSHHLGPDPLLAPGETDITMDVNFSAIAAAAREAGAEVTIERQDDFLEGLGLGSALSELRRQELDLARSGEVMERLRVRSQVTGAETLLHPRGLGDFRVMVARI
ncbi:MAG TPA: SAM-dependent methyltransferase [Acidimicrobiia bacterium]|nr:SAM-dependent methyltransferase [Acidimicrobiia bacterium]